jgi:hypothetical protein
VQGLWLACPDIGHGAWVYIVKNFEYLEELRELVKVHEQESGMTRGEF